MLRTYLFTSVLLFGVNVFSEPPDMIEMLAYEFNNEPPNEYHVLNNPDYAFENFDLDILEKIDRVPPEETCKTKVRRPHFPASTVDPNPQIFKNSAFAKVADRTHDDLKRLEHSTAEDDNLQHMDDLSLYEKLLEAITQYMENEDHVPLSGQTVANESCDSEENTFFIDAIYNHLNSIYDEENMRHINIDYYNY